MNGLNEVTLGQIALGVYAILLIIGGMIGFIKAHSRVSLAASSISAVIMVAALMMTLSGAVGATRMGFVAGALMTALLLVFFGNRFTKSKRFMPGGLMALVSLIVLVLLVVVLVRLDLPT